MYIFVLDVYCLLLILQDSSEYSYTCDIHNEYAMYISTHDNKTSLKLPNIIKWI